MIELLWIIAIIVTYCNDTTDVGKERSTEQTLATILTVAALLNYLIYLRYPRPLSSSAMIIAEIAMIKPATPLETETLIETAHQAAGKAWQKAVMVLITSAPSSFWPTQHRILR